MRLLLLSLLSLAACGPSSLDDSKQVGTTSQALQDLATSHTASSAATTPATCADEMHRYAAAAAKLMTTLEAAAPGLDSCMSGMGYREQADMMSGVSDLKEGLRSHVASGCGAANLADEMARHRGVITTHCEHLRTRTAAMGGMSMGGSMGCR